MSPRVWSLCLLAAACCAGQAAEPPAVRGTVYDPNLNNAGIGGAEVSLVEYGTKDGKETRTVLATGFTSVNGEFELRTDHFGAFYVVAHLEGYSGTHPEYDVPGAVEEPVTVDQRYAPGPVRIAMTRPGSLTGRIVASEDNRPLAHIRLAVSRGLSSDSLYTETDEDGSFAVADLPAGLYNVEIAPQGRDPVAGPFSEEEFGAVDQGVDDFDVPLQPPRVTPGGLANAGTLRAATIPYVHARVTVRSAECRPGDTWLFMAFLTSGVAREHRAAGPPRSKLACAGEFMVSNLKPGEYWFALWTESKSHWALERVRVEEENLPVAMTLTPAGQVSGRVVLPDGVPFPQRGPIVRVDLTPTIAGLPSTFAPANTDDQGRFTIANVLWSSYTLRLMQIPQGFYLKEVRSGGSPLVDGRVTPFEGGGASLEILLDNRTATITGMVFDHGHPVEGARVQVVSRGVGLFPILRSSPPTGADGSFRITGMAPGEYSASATRPSALPLALPNDPQAAPPPVTIRLAPGATQTVTIELP